MKKLMLTITMAMMSLVSVTAQEKEEQEGKGFSKGDVYVSGNLSYFSNSEEDFSDKRLSFRPTVGYFINNHIALEALLILGYTRLDSENGFFSDDDRNESFTLGGGLGATYYFTPLNKFSFKTGVSLSYSEAKFDQFTDSNRFIFQIEPGVNYFISKSFALNASIGALTYLREKQDSDGAEAENIFSLNLNLSDVNFGLTYKF